MKLLNDTQRQQLIDNFLFNETVRGSSEEVDYRPVVKLFTPDGSATWLLSELEPSTDIAFGLCDLGFGCPELGSVSLRELEDARGPLGLPIERDLYFSPDGTLSEYAKKARIAGRIVS